MELTKDQQVELVKSLATKSMLEAGTAMGLDTQYKDSRAIRNAVTSVYKKIQKKPEEYGLTQEVLELIMKSVSDRKIATITPQKPVKVEEDLDMTGLLQGAAEKSLKLINLKLDRLSRNKKNLDRISFAQLNTIAGTAIDKSRLIAGEATEHIAMIAKVDKDMSAKDAMATLLQFREQTITNKQERK